MEDSTMTGLTREISMKKIVNQLSDLKNGTYLSKIEKDQEI
jgi:hypothetical protein